MILKIVILAALIRLLIQTQKPFLCAGIYTAVFVIMGLVNGAKFVPLLIFTAVAFALASLYFWLLDRFEDNLLLFWVIAAAGLAIGLV
jgi:hypothetical protein